MRKRAYQSMSVKFVQVAVVLPRLAAGEVSVGCDVSKRSVVAVLASGGERQRQFERPWTVKNPGELALLVERLLELSRERRVRVALESTGTYGDALRRRLEVAGLVVERVSGKAVRDLSETFDGVPSSHDGKDAAIIAELAARGHATPWPLARSQHAAELRSRVLWLDAQRTILQGWSGRLEGLVTRHWPELLELLELTSKTAWRLLAHYGDPAQLAADPAAARRLAAWGKHWLSPDKIAAIVRSAGETSGVPPLPPEAELLRNYATEALAVHAKLRQTERRLRALAAADERLAVEAGVVGPITACVLRAMVGDPRDYHSGAAYRKALGLNLKERSSGRHQGQLKLTKRGSSAARRWLYFAALRVVQHPALKAWYAARRESGPGKPVLVGVMRKLSLALYAVAAHGARYDPARLIAPAARPSARPSVAAAPTT